jgi:hypothetical protein
VSNRKQGLALRGCYEITVTDVSPFYNFSSARSLRDRLIVSFNCKEGLFRNNPEDFILYRIHLNKTFLPNNKIRELLDN